MLMHNKINYFNFFILLFILNDVSCNFFLLLYYIKVNSKQYFLISKLYLVARLKYKFDYLDIN